MECKASGIKNRGNGPLLDFEFRPCVLQVCIGGANWMEGGKKRNEKEEHLTN